MSKKNQVFEVGDQVVVESLESWGILRVEKVYTDVDPPQYTVVVPGQLTYLTHILASKLRRANEKG